MSQLDMDHRCTTELCPHLGQRTDRGCRCHKTREEMLEAEVVRLSQQQSASGDPVRAWRPIVTVADWVNNLLSLDQSMQVFGVYFIDREGKKEARARGLSLSRERVADSQIKTGDETVPYSLAVWSSQDERSDLLKKEALDHARVRFECLAEEFEKAGSTVDWAMCKTDAERMAAAINAAASSDGTRVDDSLISGHNRSNDRGGLPSEANSTAAPVEGSTCYIERSKVREIFLALFDFPPGVVLSKIDALQIFTASDFLPAPVDAGIREALEKVKAIAEEIALTSNSRDKAASLAELYKIVLAALSYQPAVGTDRDLLRRVVDAAYCHAMEQPCFPATTTADIIIDAVLAGKPAESVLGGMHLPRWRHLKRGSSYTEVARGPLQASTRQPAENDIIVAYRGGDGRWFFREATEFDDGRFELSAKVRV